MTRSITQPPVTETVEEAAAFWAMRLDNSRCTPADRTAFEAWREADPRHAAAYDSVVTALARVDKVLGEPDVLALGDEVFAATEPPRRPILPSMILGLAAAVVAAIGIAFYVELAEPDKVSETPVGASTYDTAIGERSTIDLPDGSRVILNTASRIDIDYQIANRHVVLREGQALFEVAEDANRPFVVTAGDRRIVALGTAFDVRVNEDRGVQVTLIEGRVAIDKVTAESVLPVTPVSPSVESQPLVPGEQLVVRGNEQPVVATADTERVVSWREGRLIFRDDPLLDAVNEINRYSTTKLYLSNDSRLHDIRISGVFKSGRTDSFILALETVYAVEAQQVSEHRIALLLND